MKHYALVSGISILAVMTFGLTALIILQQSSLDESSFDYWRLEILKMAGLLSSALLIILDLHYQNLNKIEDLRERLEEMRK